jgi:hypothetical protein
MPDLDKLTIQIEAGPRATRVTFRHEEPLSEDMLGAILIDTGLRIIKRTLGFSDHGLGDGPVDPDHTEISPGR